MEEYGIIALDVKKRGIVIIAVTAVYLSCSPMEIARVVVTDESRHPKGIRIRLYSDNLCRRIHQNTKLNYLERTS